jgi:hypothetical protein
MAVVFFLPASAEAQTGRVTLQATVSETVTLSVAPSFSQSNVDVVSSGGNTVRITLSGDDVIIRVPLLVRSNSSFKISAELQTGELSQLSAIGAHPTGRLVSPQAISGFKSPPRLDLNTSGPVLIASGPRVSLGGTLDSPNNALQLTLLIRLNPHQTRGSLVQLTLVATAGSLIR